MDDFRYCPRCRTELVPGEEGSQRCPHCGFTHYYNVVAGVSIWPVRDGQVLLSRRGRAPRQGALDTIGGYLKPNEETEAGALREAYEETGARFRLIQLLGAYVDYTDDGSPSLVVHYLAELASGTPQPADDVGRLEWYDIQALTPDQFDGSYKNVRDGLRDLQEWFRRRTIQEDPS